MMALDNVDLKRQVKVIHFDGGHRVRAHLNTLGIHVGDLLTVVERAPFHGPVLILVHGSRLALSALRSCCRCWRHTRDRPSRSSPQHLASI